MASSQIHSFIAYFKISFQYNGFDWNQNSSLPSHISLSLCVHCRCLWRRMWRCTECVFRRAGIILTILTQCWEDSVHTTDGHILWQVTEIAPGLCVTSAISWVIHLKILRLGICFLPGLKIRGNTVWSLFYFYISLYYEKLSHQYFRWILNFWQLFES